MSYTNQQTPQNIASNDKRHVVFVLKKTEAIAAALTLVARYLKDEPQSAALLRDCALRLIKNVHDDAAPHRFSVGVSQVRTGEVISLLHMLERAGALSTKNVELLISEIVALEQLLARERFVDREPDFSQYFLREPMPEQVTAQKDIYEHYGHIKTVDSERDVQSAQEKDNYTKRQSDLQQTVPKDQRETQISVRHEFQKDRRAMILSLLQKKDKITVKDVSNVIKDVSDKTLQRELLALVAQGVLKKEGERRWSTYSLRG